MITMAPPIRNISCIPQPGKGGSVAGTTVSSAFVNSKPDIASATLFSIFVDVNITPA